MQNLSPDSTSVSVWVVIASSLISGIIGVLVTIVYSHFYEKRRMKLDVLRRFAANRFDVRGIEWTRAANEIFIVFQDSQEVMQLLTDRQRFADPDSWQDHMLKLFKAMCKDAGVKVDFNDSFFLKPFTIKPPIETKLTDSPEQSIKVPEQKKSSKK